MEQEGGNAASLQSNTMPVLSCLRRSAVLLSFFIALAVALSATPSYASGVGVSPSHLDIADNASDFDGTIYVINTGDVDSLYRVYAEKGYEGWFDISPQEFLLSSGQVAEVQVTVSSPRSISGEHTINICIESFEATSDLHVGAGIKVPVYISASKPLPVLIIGISVASLALLAMIAYLIWRSNRLLRRRKIESK